MIYWTTGTNGAGKTLLTLKDVRAEQLSSGRPVFYRGFEAAQPILDFGWKPFEAEKWQECPDGSILVFDECQEVFPVRGRGEPPQWIEDIAKYRRKRGMDFWLISPHPMMVDTFIRRLVEKPSWHRHLKRLMGGQMVGVSKYGYVETQCEKPGMGEAKGESSIVSYPKEVFGWYVSASVHTVKRSIPKQVYVLAACAVAFLGAVGGAVHYVGQISQPDKIQEPLGITAIDSPLQRTSAPDQPRTPEQFVAAYTPRVDGLAHTAPAYDSITQPKRAPLPAACIASKSQGCKCYTQDATPYPTTPDICAQVVAGGWFNDFAEQGPSERKTESAPFSVKQGSP